jgi:hypothetical protein
MARAFTTPRSARKSASARGTAPGTRGAPFRKKGKVEYPPYQVFEARPLDREAMNVERDFAAFLPFKHGYEWDAAADFLRNK